MTIGAFFLYGNGLAFAHTNPGFRLGDEDKFGSCNTRQYLEMQMNTDAYGNRIGPDQDVELKRRR